MIGGVGVPLRALPPWAQHVAGYLPGRYAVEALDACYLPGGHGLAGAKFALAALIVIGAAACVAGSRMFRWDAGQKLAPGAKPWIAFALAAWAGVGLAAECTGHLAVPIDTQSQNLVASSSPPPVAGTWQAITPSEINAVRFDNLPPDDGDVAPLVPSLADIPAQSRQRVDTIARNLETWPPAQQPGVVQRVRNLLSVAAVADVQEDPDEGAIGYVILDYIRNHVLGEDLEKILTYIINHPNGGTVLTQVPELGIQGAITEQAARERVGMYAAKLLGRMLGELPQSKK
jgi:ABC-2 type transport system permease protein